MCKLLIKEINQIPECENKKEFEFYLLDTLTDQSE